MSTLTEASRSLDRLVVQQIHPRLGAVVSGVTLSGEMDTDIIASMNNLLLRHKVIFIRGQSHLTDQEHERFARIFGDIVHHPSDQRSSPINVIDGSSSYARVNNWHADVTFKPAYARATIIRSLVVPELGGDTQWANTVTAYQDLPPVLRELANSLRAVHSNMGDFVPYRPDPDSEENKRFARIYKAREYWTEHPVVRLIPETGEHALVLGGFVKHFTSLPRADTRFVFDLLQSYIVRPENVLRWSWLAGDVAIWENRMTQHYAIDDYGNQARVMHSVTLEGDLPRGTDGRESKAIIHPPS